MKFHIPNCTKVNNKLPVHFFPIQYKMYPATHYNKPSCSEERRNEIEGGATQIILAAGPNNDFS